MKRSPRFYVVGTTGVCIEHISNWWVAECAPGGPALVVETRHGKLVHLQEEGSSPEEIMRKMIEFIEMSA